MRVFVLLLMPIVFLMLGITIGLFVDEVQQVREEYVLNSESPLGVQPHDRIKESQVQVFTDYVKIDLKNARWANFTPTGSMLPVLGTTAHALQIIPEKTSDIHIGDIISFHYENRIISHRVIDISFDEVGWYAMTQGDNNPDPDPVRIRFNEIDRILVGVLY